MAIFALTYVLMLVLLLIGKDTEELDAESQYQLGMN